MTSDITATQNFKIHYFVLKSSFLLCCNLKKPIKKRSALKQQAQNLDVYLL